MRRRSPSTGAALATVLLAAVGTTQACVFELGEVVEGAGGAGGAGGGGGAAGGGVPESWWDAAFARRMRLALTGEGEPLTDAVIPVLLSPDRIDYGTVEPGGADLRVVDADGLTELAFEIERWEPSGSSVVWVRLPELTSDDHLWLYWGNPGLPSGETPGAVWAGYEGVIHMNDSLRDTTVTNPGSGPDLTAAGFGPDNVVEGILGPAYRFDAQPMGQNISTSGSSGFAVPAEGAATVEGWFQWDGMTGSFLAEHEGCCLGWAVTLQADGDIRTSWGSSNCCSASPAYDYGGAAVPGGAGDTDWHHFVVIYDRQAGTSQLYLDGEPAEAPTVITPAESFSPQGSYRIGADFSGNNSFGGILDEARFATFAYEPARVRLHARAARDEVIVYGDSEVLP